VEFTLVRVRAIRDFLMSSPSWWMTTLWWNWMWKRSIFIFIFIFLRATLHQSLRALEPWYTNRVIGRERRRRSNIHFRLHLEGLTGQRNSNGWKIYTAAYMTTSGQYFMVY
jgi:hypothetical protein